MKNILLLLTNLFVLATWANTTNPVPYQQRDSDHIKEIFTAWNATNGAYLYNSVNALVMNSEQPHRPQGLEKTPFELLQSMGDQRVDRLERIAQQELENERNAGRNEQYYWEEWLKVVKSSRCSSTSRGDSNGDPHMRTYDGESFDFQNAGDYLLTASSDNRFMIQTQQVRLNKSISLNGAVSMNVNGDQVEMLSIDEHNGEIIFVINGQQMPNVKSNFVLPQGGVVTYANNAHTVKWPTGEQMKVSVRKFQGKQLYDLAVNVPKCRSDYRGLLGNNDGVRNDLVARDPVTGSEIRRGEVSTTYEDIFGENRRNPVVMDRATQDLVFLSREYGSQFQLDSLSSTFTNRMTELPDEIRYPEIHLTLAELDDAQIAEGLRRAREAGVSEEDLFGAVYDYGHLGLDPVAYNDDYVAPTKTPIIEPTVTDDRAQRTTAEEAKNEIAKNAALVIIGAAAGASAVRTYPTYPTYHRPTPPVYRNPSTHGTKATRRPTTSSPTKPSSPRTPRPTGR
ncbi:MAG: VWD domain-containing protein [Brumimicrobium sp.]|nr:VWD domain-containing protein [Brumimicrobium sp.]